MEEDANTGTIAKSQSIRYIPLDRPFESLCLTDFLPTTDVQHIPRIMNQPSILATSGYWHEAMTPQLAEEWMIEQRFLNRHFPFSGE